MDDRTLHRFAAPITATLRDRLIEQIESPRGLQRPVHRDDGSSIDLTTLDDLMTTLTPRFYDDDWARDRTLSDRWLAPRLHYALRLTRAQAGDRGLWNWIAVRYSAYVNWRWTDTTTGAVNEDRWNGPVHKQALMRLWWGAELFRDGPDYSPAERAFLRQDLPNSYLHRPLVRCRSLALAIVDIIAPTGDLLRSSGEVNDLARVLNLATTGCPPELETCFQQDDHDAYQTWLQHSPVVPVDWDDRPIGPAAHDTTTASLAGGRAITERGWSYAVHAKRTRPKEAGEQDSNLTP